jgi:hypothetical protein
MEPTAQFCSDSCTISELSRQQFPGTLAVSSSGLDHSGKGSAEDSQSPYTLFYLATVGRAHLRASWVPSPQSCLACNRGALQRGGEREAHPADGLHALAPLEVCDQASWGQCQRGGRGLYLPPSHQEEALCTLGRQLYLSGPLKWRELSRERLDGFLRGTI